MSALIFVKAKKLLALISFMHEKWVNLNILGLSALIFLALVTRPFLFMNKTNNYFIFQLKWLIIVFNYIYF
jgi:hypothetical protein